MKLLRKIQRNGWRYTFAIAFNRIVPQWLFRMRRYVIYRLAVPEEGSTANDQISVVCCIDEAAIQEVETLTYFSRRYSSGQSSAYAAKIAGQLAGGMWAATKTFDENELGVRLRLCDQQVWLFAALVSQDFRRQGVYSVLLPFVMSDLHSRGLTEQLVAVNPDNLGSNRLHQQRSESTVGYVLAIRLLKFTACWTWGDIRKDRTFSWNSQRQPVEIRVEAK